MKILAFLSMVFLCSCSSLSPISRNAISFTNIRDVIPGRMTQQEISRKFGPPSEKSAGDEEQWIFLEKSGETRLTVTFKGDKTVKSLLWTPSPADPESRLSILLSRYPSARFQVSAADSKGPEFIPSEANYRDPRIGVTIFCEPKQDRVLALGFYEPKE